MEDSHVPLRSERESSPPRAALASDAASPKPFNASVCGRLAHALRRPFRRRSNSASSSAFELRHSSVTATRTPEQVAAENHLKKQIEKYSTMRVHMKRVQLCLEQEKRNKFYKELIIYVVFLVVVMSSLLSLPIHFPYEQNAALTDLFFDEEFRNISIKKTFEDVMVEGELWEWVQGPFLDGYYDLPIRNMRRIGSAIVRTGRVKGELCRRTNGRSDFVLFDDEFCFPAFSPQHEFTEPYGDDATREVFGQPYTWTSDLSKLLRSQTFTPSLFNHEMDYGKGGYTVYLPRDNEAAARAAVAQLTTDFLTDSSRYFALSFAFYNPRSDIFTHVQALVEMSDTDYIETSARVKSFRIMESFKDGGFLLDNWFVIVLVGATLWLVVREFTDLREFGLNKYMQSLWNLLDMFQLVLLFIFIEKWVTFLLMCEDMRAKLYAVARMDCSGPASDQTAARACFVDVEPLAWQFLSVTNFAAALALVSIAIVFKYLRLNTRLNLLWRTLRFAAKDLLAFVVIFFVIFIAYAIMGFLTFGSSVRQYHSLSVSLTSCFQMLLGAFDYKVIYEANPTMAGLFFFSFMVSVYLICVNMFIAIMSEYYSLAQDEKKKYEEHKKSLIGGRNATDESGGGASSSNTENNSTSDASSAATRIHGDEYLDVEYDLAKQLQSYIRGLRVQVRLPPRKDKVSIYDTEQVVISGYQRVLLVDYEYLMAERKRLKLKLKGYVQSVMAVTFLMRLVRPDFRMKMERGAVPDRRPRRTSSATITDELVEFPVTYIPIDSRRADTVALLVSLAKGTIVDMDDGSLTKDQLTLEVLGGQEAYIPPRFKRRDVATPVANDDLHVRISHEQGDDDDSKSRAFGLSHVHERIGSGTHIRACRVLYDGDTVLDGMEACMLPRRTWATYFMVHALWGSITSAIASCFGRNRKTQTTASRLITDVDMDHLIREHFVAPGRGISCRFDELVRNFRMLIAKKAHKKHWHIANLEERIFIEAIAFVERFPSALSPLDQRELEGYKYTPQPVDTTRVRLPNSVRLLAELLAQNAHEVWAVGRINQGWRWGPARDNDKMLHPDLMPYEELTEQTKQYDRDTSIEALKVITALGYVLEPPARGYESADFEVAFGEPALMPGGTYEPKPIPTDSVKVPSELRSLIELLAENTHEVWSKMRMSQGWKYGLRRDDDKLEHNGLVPYIYLTQEEKQMDRNTALQTVKLILRCGFTFVHRDKRSGNGGGHRSSRKARSMREGSGSGSSMRVFGRNENPEARNVGEAVTLARSTARAKGAFMRHGAGSASQRALSVRLALSASSSSGSLIPETVAEESEDAERSLETSASSTEADGGGGGGVVPVLQRAGTLPIRALSGAVASAASASSTAEDSSPVPERVDQITRSSSAVV